MKKRGSVLVVSCLVLLLGVFSFWSSFAKEAVAQAKTFKFGLISSMTGPMAPPFKSLIDAAKPAGDLMNKRGGITVQGQKYMVEVVPEDDQSSPPGAVAAVNRLIQAGIKFIYAPQFMVSNMAIAPIAEEAKILRIKGLGVGKEEVGPSLRYSFYASAQLYNVPVCYDYLKKNYPKVKKIALITPDDPGAKTIIELTEKEIQKRGLEIVFQEAFKIGSEDFYPILTKALEKKPDAIDMVLSIAPWSAGVINQSRELGFTGPIYATIHADTNILRSMLNPKYAYDVFHAAPDVLSPKMTPIMKDYRVLIEQQTKTTFNLDHGLLLEGLYPLLQGIEKAQSFDTDKVVATLENMKSIDTPYGRGSMSGQDLFGINHVIVRPFTLSRIMKDKIEFEFIEK
ncbi:MAG: ABC transporter substrate-binding protein [Thermodesulfobacteriota bacterium]|jgi:branched-chain amino acid transport system substrate-binding protein